MSRLDQDTSSDWNEIKYSTPKEEIEVDAFLDAQLQRVLPLRWRKNLSKRDLAGHCNSAMLPKSFQKLFRRSSRIGYAFNGINDIVNFAYLMYKLVAAMLIIPFISLPPDVLVDLLFASATETF